MIEVNISTLKNELSAYLRKVKKGEEVVILDRDRPVARISRLTPRDAIRTESDRLDDLERRGIITRAKKKLPKDWFERHPPIKLPEGVSVVEALLEERREAKY